VWDENFDPMSNVIDVYARRLRKKADEGSLDDRRFFQVYDLFTGVGATIV
jgi:DNA-binding response OmpR family regulator